MLHLFRLGQGLSHPNDIKIPGFRRNIEKLGRTRSNHLRLSWRCPAQKTVEDLSTIHTTHNSIEARNSSMGTIMLDRHHRLRPMHYGKTRKPGKRGIMYSS